MTEKPPENYLVFAKQVRKRTCNIFSAVPMAVYRKVLRVS